jgi:hypothetical protein
MSSDDKKSEPSGLIVRTGRAFAPVSKHEDRPNSKTLVIVHRDGSLSERVSLQVADPAHREQLILLHYLRNYARCFLDEDTTVTIHSRDAPWDFDVELGTERRFFLEITAIADSKYEFEKKKREERLRGLTGKLTIRLRDLRKLADLFPGTAEEALKSHAHEPPDTPIDNPLFGEQPPLILGSISPPGERLAKQLCDAIMRKSQKRHAGKERTVLIIDYRGEFYDAPDVYEAAEEVAEKCADAPFPEIWVYVGYFSSDDGRYAEFSFTPLRLAPEQWERFQKLVEERGIDQHGRIIW